MAETDQAPDPKGSSGGLVMFVVVVPLLYLLSVGPVAAVASRIDNTRTIDVLEKIYAPVIWLYDHTVLEKPLEAYLALWGVK